MQQNRCDSGAEGQLHLEGSVKTTKWKLHWLPNISELVPLRLVDFDHLITKKKLEEGDAIEDFVNKHSVSHPEYFDVFMGWGNMERLLMSHFGPIHVTQYMQTA